MGTSTTILKSEILNQFSEDKKMNPSKKFIAFPFSYHEEIEIHITDLNNMGCGVGRKVLSDGSNWVVLVPYTIPGENVICRIYHNHLSYSEADLVRVLEPSPERVSPLCKYFGNCGGCQYQVSIKHNYFSLY
jgi:23S rRNA (uracil1939-C5)-methyltransferase/tRNA (uracil-5-)-methyltransferase